MPTQRKPPLAPGGWRVVQAAILSFWVQAIACMRPVLLQTDADTPDALDAPDTWFWSHHLV